MLRNISYRYFELRKISLSQSKIFVQKITRKKDWILSSDAFNKLLNWLDEGVNSDGQKYLDVRQRLLDYFDRKNCLSPDDLADETINRVARRLDEEGFIESETPAKYFYITARFVFMEYLRDTQNQNVSIDETEGQQHLKKLATIESDEKETKEKMLNCLEKCTGKLDENNREIILRYYIGKEREKIENRRALAQDLGISINALSIRACRIRDKLETCVKQCINAE